MAVQARPADVRELPSTPSGLASLLGDMLIDPSVPVAIEAFDGSRWGPADPVATIVVANDLALRRFATAPGQLGLGRAYIAGDVDVTGDLLAGMDALARRPPRLTLQSVLELGRALGPGVLRPVPPPMDEASLTGRRHSIGRDREAVAHHYDVGNDFYRILLGDSMTYSCAVWQHESVSLLQAQDAKHQLVADKLALRPGMRVLDVGCGWGSMAMRAARDGAEVVGVTLSAEQADLARERVAAEGLSEQIEIRLQDYREVDDGPFDAISSVGMVEHVGRARLAEYFRCCYDLLKPGGRMLNHGITKKAQPPRRLPLRMPMAPWDRRSFIDRYVFPDGELHEMGWVVSVMQEQGFEVRHSENLREHYALTLRAWLDNLERDWDRAVSLVGQERARVWRFYLASSAVGFDLDLIQIHQVLGVKGEDGRSGFPLRPAY